MNTLLVFVAVLAAFIILWLVLSKKKDTEKVVTYECPQCGEHHCDCYKEGEIKPPSDSA